jgi:predicted lipoprotein with Yx(FWY)xxD motif
MRPVLKSVLPAAVAALTLAACGSSGSSSQTSSATTAAAPASGTSVALVKTASNPNVKATVLTNGQGMTLYSLSGEKAGKFICTGACLKVWVPVSAPASGTPTGVSGLATVKRPEGTVQVTYNGAPLYTFAQDQAPGEDKGEGVKDVGTWTVVKVSPSASSSSAPAAPASSESSGSEPAGSAEPSSSESSGSKGGYSY